MYCYESQVGEEQADVNIKALINPVRVKLVEKYMFFFSSRSWTLTQEHDKIWVIVCVLTPSSRKIMKEHYTEANIPLGYKKSITSLRISTPKLEVEIGHYQKPTPVPAYMYERICVLCN